MAKDHFKIYIHKTPGVIHIVRKKSTMYATPKHRELIFSKPINVPYSK